jgi:hypothetical protein
MGKHMLPYGSTPFRNACMALGVIASMVAMRTQAQGLQARFDILRGTKVLGQVFAFKTDVATRTLYRMSSYAEFNLAWKQTIRTTMATEYHNGQLSTCYSTVSVNNTVRDSSHMAKGSDRCYVHPELPFTCERSTQWTTARMYFEEPIGQDHIFVESALQDLPLRRTGDGKYILTFPNGNVNTYIYRSGVLEEIHVKRPLVGLVFRRV